MCSPEENQIAALTEEVALEKGLSELRRHDAEQLRKALSELTADLEDRAKWMRFTPAKDGLTVPCGSGVYMRAKDALEQTSPKQPEETGP